jgi:integrase
VKNGPVFRSVNTDKLPAQVGEAALSVISIYNVIVGRAQKAGITHKHPHELRHSFVSWRLDAGVPAFSVMGVTGHKLDKESPEIVMRYSGVMVAEKALAATPAWLKELVLDLETS